jgi:GntR family transcriptional regulator
MESKTAGLSLHGVDRSSPVPYYHQLKVLLRGSIESGELSVGDTLPGEMRMCDIYDVSRTVVRQALTELEFEGLIAREKGRGTFVASPKTSQGLVQSLTGQFEDLAARGLHLKSDVRRLDEVPAGHLEASQLQIEEGSPVILLDRLRSVGGEAWVTVLTYLPIELMSILTGADLENGSLYAVLSKHGVRPCSGKRTLEAREAGKEVAKDLGIRRGAPVMLLTSVGFSDAGKPVESFQAFHRGDRVRFEADLVRAELSPRPTHGSYA